eukprot:scpid54053/ scgid0522/ Zinc finger FYVE domain-containing protein 1; Double FYVE-containing protein 1; SR3; Tandem FYVE fingers-1
MQHLNKKFDGQLPESLDKMFPDEYFTCQAVCEACNCRCDRTMNHDKDCGSGTSSAGATVPTRHNCEKRCVYQAELDNKVYLCRGCLTNGREQIVVPKMAQAQSSLWGGLLSNAVYGYVIECPQCGVIFRERERWYGNKDPSECAVRDEIRHVWPGEKIVGTRTQNAGRRLLEGVSTASSVVSSIGATPARFLADWVADSIAPDYWVPNAQITNCKKCKKDLTTDETRHHCRACGEGFCKDCSSHSMPVEWRGWPANAPVRVCDTCFENGPEPATPTSENGAETADVPSTTPRRMGEVVAIAASAVAGAMEYPKAMLKDAARPAYWVADKDITQCSVCSQDFNEKLLLHHCRACGNGVCDGCSQKRRTVPDRGWDMDVRVCDKCFGNNEDE